MSRFRIPRRSRRPMRTDAPFKRTLQLELLEMRCVLTGTFTPISLPTNSNGLGTLLLLTDGTVLAHETEQPDSTSSPPNLTYTGTKAWWRLSPDATGHYTGTSWTQALNMIDQRAFFTEQVLPSGKVLALGSECPKHTYEDDCQTVELFDPANNTWAKVTVHRFLEKTRRFGAAAEQPIR